MDWVDGEGSVSTTFEAIDQRKVDMLATMRDARARSSAVSPKTRAFAVGMMVTPLIVAGACLTSAYERPAAKAAGFALMIVSVLVLGALQRAASAPPRAPNLDVRSVFEVRITREALVLSADGAPAAEIALLDVADVLGGLHLDVVRQDGTHVRLPFKVVGSADLAVEIRTRVRDMRAVTGGYRG